MCPVLEGGEELPGAGWVAEDLQTAEEDGSEAPGSVAHPQPGRRPERVPDAFLQRCVLSRVRTAESGGDPAGPVGAGCLWSVGSSDDT